MVMQNAGFCLQSNLWRSKNYKMLMKQQFFVTHRHTLLQKTEINLTDLQQANT